MDKSVGIYWLKRDFRILDNPALVRSLRLCDQILTLYIVEPSMLEAGETSDFHLHAIDDAFNGLRDQIISKSGEIYHSKSEVLKLLDKLYKLSPFHFLFSHEEIGNDRTYQRDIEVKSWCKAHDVKWIELRQTGVFRGLDDRDKRSRLWRKFYDEPILSIPDDKAFLKLRSPDLWKVHLSAEKLTFKLSENNNFDRSMLQPVSEMEAHHTLTDFLNERGIAYSGGISSPLTAMTAGSRMSVHLAWGTISGRYVYQQNLEKKEYYKDSNHPEAGKWRRSLTAFQARLHWRDHFIQRLETEPQMEFQALNEAYEALEYAGKDEWLQAWKEGATGYPMVDACIRCLRSTGFINFRMRAMLTSFACHVLHISWKHIDHPMARLYTDYEPGIHLSQLQMQAGVVGINTIRIYNPTKQISDHDPDCIFIKNWIPELRDFSPSEIVAHSSTTLGSYPAQIVDYSEMSKLMRSQLYSIKGRSATKEIAARVYEKHGSRKGPSSKRKKQTK